MIDLPNYHLRRHVWANFCLSHNNTKLIDDRALLRDFYIRNNAQVSEDDCRLTFVFELMH